MTVQGAVHAVGSSTVTSYWSVLGPTRVKRSIVWRFSAEPLKSLKVLFGEKFVVSTTSVSPSQWPRESPCHWRTLSEKCGLPSRGITRTSWIVSWRTMT